MTDSRQFLCTVVTPEKIVLERQVRFAAVPAHDGEIGFLKGRAPLVVKLDVGRLRVETDEGTEELFIDGGFAEMVHDKLTILTEDARRPEDLDRDRTVREPSAGPQAGTNPVADDRRVAGPPQEEGQVHFPGLRSRRSARKGDRYNPGGRISLRRAAAMESMESYLSPFPLCPNTIRSHRDLF